LTLAAVVVVLAFFVPFVRDSVDTAFNPWAHSWRGRPTLTGTWVGTIATPAGRGVVLFLDLRRARTGRGNNRYSTCRTCPRIKGAARVCGSDKSYEVWGGPDTWGGERFHLNMSPPDRGQFGAWLGYLSGEWAGDSLSLATKPEQDGGHVRFEMRRGAESDFATLCRESGAGW
jgi:hypothetical protein